MTLCLQNPAGTACKKEGGADPRNMGSVWQGDKWSLAVPPHGHGTRPPANPANTIPTSCQMLMPILDRIT